MPASRAQQTVTAKRREQATQMRLAGVELAVIQRKLGYSSVAAVSKDLRRAWENARKEANTSATDLHTQSVMRLERLLAGHWAAAIGGSTKSADLCLKILERLDRRQGVGEKAMGTETARSVLGDLAAALKVASNLLPEGDLRDDQEPSYNAEVAALAADSDDADGDMPPATAGFLGAPAAGADGH
jgi:hypothetical protein